MSAAARASTSRRTDSGPRMLSIRPPWAWAIAAGHKKVENRKWTTRYRGELFIHASLTKDPWAVEWLTRKGKVQLPPEFISGAIIAVAELADVVEERSARQFGRWFFGPYGLVLRNVRVLNSPVKATGRLGLVRPSPALVRAVRAQLK